MKPGRVESSGRRKQKHSSDKIRRMCVQDGRKDTQSQSRLQTGFFGGRARLTGEFDPGSERTLAACLTHASRAGAAMRLAAYG